MSQWGQYTSSRWIILNGFKWDDLRSWWGKTTDTRITMISLNVLAKLAHFPKLRRLVSFWFTPIHAVDTWNVDKGFLVCTPSGRKYMNIITVYAKYPKNTSMLHTKCNCWFVVQDPSWAWITTAWNHRHVPAVSLHPYMSRFLWLNITLRWFTIYSTCV